MDGVAGPPSLCVNSNTARVLDYMKPVERVGAFGITHYKYESVGDGDWGFLKYNNKQNMELFFSIPPPSARHAAGFCHPLICASSINIQNRVRI